MASLVSLRMFHVSNVPRISPARNFSISSVVACSQNKKSSEDKRIVDFPLYNKSGTRQFKKEQHAKRRNPKYPDIPIHRYGVRDTVVKHHAGTEKVAEMIPELVVPDLEDCTLKPYVAYSTKEIYQDELTARDLFNVIYGQKIITDFKAGKLDQDGNPQEPSAAERITAEEAYIKARQTGSDIFQGGEPVNKEFMLDIPVGKI